MKAVLLIQTEYNGMFDLSLKSRNVALNESRVTKEGFNYYYDLSKDTAIKWDWDNDLDIAQRVITIEGWVQLSGDTPDLTTDIFGGHANNSWSHGIRVSLGGPRMVITIGGGTPDYGVYTDMPTNTPVHFAWVLDGTNKTLYVNGVNVHSSPIVGGITTPEAMTFGYAAPDNINKSTASDTKVSQFIVWSGAKYLNNFTPEYIVYDVQSLIHLTDSGFYKRYEQSSVSSIADKVLIKGIPTMRKVCLYLRVTNELVATTWSDVSGNYQFNNLQPNTEYYVLALDHERNYNAVIQDMIRTDR